MEYSKPEVTSVGKAVDSIQSSLSKASKPNDSDGMRPFTAAAAYQADE